MQLPHSIVALRITVEIFRVLGSDTPRVSINTLVDYVNKVELFPLSISQLLQLF